MLAGGCGFDPRLAYRPVSPQSPGIAVQLFGGIAILTGISSLTNYSSCLQTIASDLLPGHVGNHFLRGLQRGRRVQARP